MSDFFDNHDGNAPDYMRESARFGGVARDAWADFMLGVDPRLGRVLRKQQNMARQRVLLTGVEVPSRGNALDGIMHRLAQSRHDVTVSTVVMQPKGKFENVDDAVASAPEPLSAFDWLAVVDDDIDFPENFLDDYLAIAAAADLVVSQPAHRFRSYATYAVTRRRVASIARRTCFVEIGPLTVIRREAFSALIPFPPSRWAYGIDVLWAEIARRNGWRMGVVDALPIRHLKPVAATYSIDEAIDEGRQLLNRFDVRLNRRDLFADYEPLALR